jgi:hypothetical protein
MILRDVQGIRRKDADGGARQNREGEGAVDGAG